MNYEQKIQEMEDLIKRATARIEELKADQETPPVWKPAYGEFYYVNDSDVASRYDWSDDVVDEFFLEVGNIFKTEQEARAHHRARKLIETIRRERFKAQGAWWPREHDQRFAVSWDMLDRKPYINSYSWVPLVPVFGLWQDRDTLIDVVNKHEDELTWYFAEHLLLVN